VTPLAQLLSGGGLFVLASAILVYAATRKRDRSTDSQERFAANIELNKYVDGRIELATGPLLAKIERLESLVTAQGSRETQVKNILRGFFQRLLFWDGNGRRGRMPMPTLEDMDVLDLEVVVEDSEAGGATVVALRQPTAATGTDNATEDMG
jgi:hypothetical protein